MKTMIWTTALALTLANVASYADEPAAAPSPAAAVAPSGEHKGEGKGLEKRVENQHKRIDHMKEKGKISEQEAAALNQKVDSTAAKIEDAKKDGITKDERKAIREDLKATRQEMRKARKNKK